MSDDSIRVSPGRPVGGGSHSNRPDVRLPLDLIVAAVISIAILIAAAADDGFDAHSAWLYVTILGAAFIIGRGLRNHHH